MKWISLVVSLLFACNLYSQDSSDLLRTPQRADPFPRSHTGESVGLIAGKVELSPDEYALILASERTAIVHLPSLDRFTANETDPLKFKRTEIFASGSSIRLVRPEGVTKIDPHTRIYYLATNASTGIGLAVDTVDGAITGFAVKGKDRMELSGAPGQALEFKTLDNLPEGADSCATEAGRQEGLLLAGPEFDIPLSMSDAPTGSTLSYQAEVAIDADSEWMAFRNNNPATATTWIADLFLAMNVFYERDVETRLLVGDVTLRTGSDPYSVASNRSQQLDEFSDYWRQNLTNVDRDFAAMFSGRGIDSNFFSGIAWIDQYCKKGFVQGDGRTVGSYSFNAIGESRTPGNTALGIGHELAHNMGSRHTHCYSPALDNCYGSESGCYSGSVSCPAGGTGTIMSYCHFSGNSGGAGCGANKSEFHPTVQALIEGKLAQNSPSCIAPYVSEPPGEVPFFIDGFEQ